MKFRFTADQFMGIDMSEPGPSLSRHGLEPFQAKRLADEANALLEAELAKCERVYRFNDPETRMPFWSETKSHGDTRTALLWNVEKIEGEK